MTDANRMVMNAGVDRNFEPNPALSSPCRGALELQLEELKESLLAPLLGSVTSTALACELRWVANEAAALAWFTACPLLVLPALLEEKVGFAMERWERQCAIRCRYSGKQQTWPAAGISRWNLTQGLVRAAGNQSRQAA